MLVTPSRLDPLLPVVVVEGAPQPVDPVRRRPARHLLHRLDLLRHRVLAHHALLAHLHGRTELIRICHHARLRRRLVPVLTARVAPLSDAGAARAPATAAPRDLSRGDAVAGLGEGQVCLGGRGLGLLLSVVVEVVEEQAGLLGLELVGEELLDLLLLGDGDLEGRGLLGLGLLVQGGSGGQTYCARVRAVVLALVAAVELGVLFDGAALRRPLLFFLRAVVELF